MSAPTITAELHNGPISGKRIDVDVVEGRPPKTIDVPDGGRTYRARYRPESDWMSFNDRKMVG